MTSLVGWVRSLFRGAPGLAPASYARAMAETDDLVERMRMHSASNDPVRGLMADLYQERHNVPYLTTLWEANQEMLSGTRQPRRKAE